MCLNGVDVFLTACLVLNLSIYIKKNSRFDPFDAKYISLINKVTETEHIFLYFIAGVFVVSFIDMHCLSNKLNISKGKFLGMLITDYASQTYNILDKICVST